MWGNSSVMCCFFAELLREANVGPSFASVVCGVRLAVPAPSSSATPSARHNVHAILKDEASNLFERVSVDACLERAILTQCAQSARQLDPKMREFYERTERKHGPSKAIIAVAREMLAIMHVMLTRNEPYHGEKQQLTTKNIDDSKE